MTRTDITRRFAAAAVTVLAIGLVAVRCTSSRSPSPAPSGLPTSPASTSGSGTFGSGSGAAASGTAAGAPSSSPELAAGEVTAAYRGYWAARVRAQAAPARPIPPELDTYAIDRARTDLKASILLFRQRGIAFRGRPVLSPVVTLTGTGPERRASIADCVDSTAWTPVFVDTGRSALAPGQPTRVVFESTARRYAGRWVIESLVAHRDRPC